MGSHYLSRCRITDLSVEMIQNWRGENFWMKDFILVCCEVSAALEHFSIGWGAISIVSRSSLIFILHRSVHCFHPYDERSLSAFDYIVNLSHLSTKEILFFAPST